MSECDWDKCTWCETKVNPKKSHLAISYEHEGTCGWVTFCNRECLEKSISVYLEDDVE